jgi:hypothetical protein
MLCATIVLGSEEEKHGITWHTQCKMLEVHSLWLTESSTSPGEEIYVPRGEVLIQGRVRETLNQTLPLLNSSQCTQSQI